jgi:hypothetical protein
VPRQLLAYAVALARQRVLKVAALTLAALVASRNTPAVRRG